MVLMEKEGIMAIVVLNPMIKSVHGRLGNLVFRRTPNGKMSVIKLADMSNVQWSEAQQRHRRQFKAAIEYAKAVMAEPTVRLVYEKMASRQNKRPFHLALSDYFKGNNLLTDIHR